MSSIEMCSICEIWGSCPGVAEDLNFVTLDHVNW